MTPITPPAIRASFPVPDEAGGRRVADILGESIDADTAAVTAFEQPDGHGWAVALHFAEAPNEAALRDLVALAAGENAAAALVFDTVEARDWVAASLDGLKPVEAGRFVVHGSHDRHRIPANKLGIEVEAALAFGTGHHGTTRGCLLLLDAVLRRQRPARVLDLGTGTGVLAMAAAKALRLPVLASDIDPQAVRVARDNARRNGVGEFVDCIQATGLGSPVFQARGPFDLVLANILANPLRAMATELTRHLAPNALVILSGLLPAHAGPVIAAYRARGLRLARRIEVEGWSSLLMHAPAAPQRVAGHRKQL
jgi:ribosomal protein L11 methyltransferase